MAPSPPHGPDKTTPRLFIGIVCHLLQVIFPLPQILSRTLTFVMDPSGFLSFQSISSPHARVSWVLENIWFLFLWKSAIISVYAPYFSKLNTCTCKINRGVTDVLRSNFCHLMIPLRVFFFSTLRFHINIFPFVQICYGLTETSPVTNQTLMDDPVDLRVSTVGRVHSNVEVISDIRVYTIGRVHLKCNVYC